MYLYMNTSHTYSLSRTICTRFLRCRISYGPIMSPLSIREIYLAISCRVASLAPGQSICPWALSRVGCFPCLLGGVAWVAVGCFLGPVRFAALADMWMRPMTCLFFCILLCLIISIPRELTIYVCLIISLPRGFTIFVVLRHPCTYWHCIFLHYLWSYTSLGLMLFVVKTTWNKAYSILFYSMSYMHIGMLKGHPYYDE